MDIRGDLKDGSLKKPHVKMPKQTNNNQPNKQAKKKPVINPKPKTQETDESLTQKSLPEKATGNVILYLYMIRSNII